MTIILRNYGITIYIFKLKNLLSQLINKFFINLAAANILVF